MSDEGYGDDDSDTFCGICWTGLHHSNCPNCVKTDIIKQFSDVVAGIEQRAETMIDPADDKISIALHSVVRELEVVIERVKNI